MTSRLSFRWLLTLLTLIAPAALGSPSAVGRPEGSPEHQDVSDVVFRHYL